MASEQSEYFGYIQSKRHDENDNNKRNGFYKKAVQSVNSTFLINISKDRFGNFKARILELIKDKKVCFNVSITLKAICVEYVLICRGRCICWLIKA
jgi:hypothetical protein